MLAYSRSEPGYEAPRKSREDRPANLEGGHASHAVPYFHRSFGCLLLSYGGPPGSPRFYAFLPQLALRPPAPPPIPVARMTAPTAMRVTPDLLHVQSARVHLRPREHLREDPAWRRYRRTRRSRRWSPPATRGPPYHSATRRSRRRRRSRSATSPWQKTGAPTAPARTRSTHWRAAAGDRSRRT